MRREEECEEIFRENAPFWHLYSPGNLRELIIKEEKEYIDAMNIIAFCASQSDNIQILTFQVMSNHFHFVVSGSEKSVEEFGELLRKKILRIFYGSVNSYIAKEFSFKHILIDNLLYLRNVIAYINRNGYLVNENHTPFSYPWGANSYFFNQLHKMQNKTYISYTSIREKKKMFKTHLVDIPTTYYVTDGYINPYCYCKIDLAENIFKNAQQYFTIISRRVESFTEIAKELEDKVFYTDNEIYQIVTNLCLKNYNVKKASELQAADKLTMAILLKNKYNCTKKQVARLLSLEQEIIAQLFPTIG